MNYIYSYNQSSKELVVYVVLSLYFPWSSYFFLFEYFWCN